MDPKSMLNLYSNQFMNCIIGFVFTPQPLKRFEKVVLFSQPDLYKKKKKIQHLEIDV